MRGVNRIVWDADAQRWNVHYGPWSDAVEASFPTLAAAEEYVCGREPEVET